MAKQIVRGVSRLLTRKVPSTHFGHTWINDGRETADVEVEVDFEKIGALLGDRALANKSGTSRYINGAIIIRVIPSTRKREAA